MTNARTKPGRRAALTATACLTALAAGAEAQTIRNLPSQAGIGTDPGPNGRRFNSQWTVNLRTTYSDNFRRINDERPRFVLFETTQLDPPPGDDPAVERRSAQYLAQFDPPSGVIFTAEMRGGTVYESPGLVGIVRGGLQASINADDRSIDDRLADEPVPDALAPDGTEITDVLFSTYGLSDEQELFVRPDLAASGTARIVDQLFYVDVAGVAQQQLINQRDAVATEADGRLGDVTTFVGGSVSPYLNRELGGRGVVEARYRLSGVAVAAENYEPEPLLDAPAPDAPDPEDRRFANDSVSQEALLEYRTGQLFSQLDITVRGSAARSDESGSDILDAVELTRLTAQTEASYALGTGLSVKAALGYDDVSIEERAQDGGTDAIDTDAREGAFSGVFWSIGGGYRPSTRSSVSLSFGERFGGTQISGDLTYRPSARLSVTGSAQRTLGTGTQDGFSGAIGVNSRTLQIVQQLSQIQAGSAQELLDRVVSFQGGFSNIQQQAFGVQVRDTYSLSASYAARRTDLGLSVFVTDSAFGEGDNARSNNRYALQASAQRRVSRRTTVGLSGRFERIEGVVLAEAVLDDRPNQPQTSDQVYLAINGSYRIGPRLAATARAYRVQSEGALSGFGIAREYEENAVSAGLSWTF